MEIQSRATYQVVLEVVFVSLLLVSSGMLNVISCVIFWKQAALQTWHNVFTINLIIVDLISGISTMFPAVLALGFGEWIMGDAMCQISGYVNAVLASIVVSTLTLFSFSRYQLFVHPRHYIMIWNKKICLLALTVAWVTAVAVSLPPLFGVGRYKFLPKNAVCFLDFTAHRAFSSIYVYVFLAVPLAFAVFYLIRLFVAFRAHRDQRVSTAEPANTQFGQTIRAAKSLLVIAICFVVCWTPAFVVFGLVGLDFDVSRHICLFSTFMVYIFALILPLIFAATSSVFKSALKKFLQFLPYMQRSSAVNPADIRAARWNNLSQSTLGNIDTPTPKEPNIVEAHAPTFEK